MVIKKLRSHPDCLTIKITKTNDDRVRKQRLRKARVYEHRMMPDMVKSRTKDKWDDTGWDCILPNEVFQWYDPLRKKYAKEAVLEMQRTLAGKLRKNEKRDELATEMLELITL